jgi:pimeloyl-ACP methyl ester carboxylesterase
MIQGVTSPMPGAPNLASVDEIAVQVGARASHVFWFHAQQANGRLAIYHAGHSERLGDVGGDGAIRMLVELGFDVLGFFMPGYGPNTPVAGPEPRHQAFAAEETVEFSPLIYFLEPITVALNAVLSRQSYLDVTMLGISGGGWSTTIYAAIDPRIRTSFAIAGSLPAFLREAPCSTVNEHGDWEQLQAALFQQVDYTQLYVLGAAGQHRRMFQIFNQYDNCCFWGLRYQVYESNVAATVDGAGPGKFAVWLDSTTRDQHVISSWALSRIEAALG